MWVLRRKWDPQVKSAIIFWSAPQNEAISWYSILQKGKWMGEIVFARQQQPRNCCYHNWQTSTEENEVWKLFEPKFPFWALSLRVLGSCTPPQNNYSPNLRILGNAIFINLWLDSFYLKNQIMFLEQGNFFNATNLQKCSVSNLSELTCVPLPPSCFSLLFKDQDYI